MCNRRWSQSFTVQKCMIRIMKRKLRRRFSCGKEKERDKDKKLTGRKNGRNALCIILCNQLGKSTALAKKKK